jgi:hypothetical protein
MAIKTNQKMHLQSQRFPGQLTLPAPLQPGQTRAIPTVTTIGDVFNFVLADTIKYTASHVTGWIKTLFSQQANFAIAPIRTMPDWTGPAVYL